MGVCCSAPFSEDEPSQAACSSRRALPECTVCWDSPVGQILQCAEGHLICAACDNDLHVRKCPTCRIDLGPIERRIRSRVAEQVIADSIRASERCIKRRDGSIDIFVGSTASVGNGKHVRTEFAPGHKWDGKIWHFVGGKHVRTEYAPGHAKHGKTCYYDDRKQVRTEYAPGHAKHGEICHFVHGKHARTEFAPGHKWDGKIWHFVGGKHVRTEYAPGHAKHGKICYYDDRKQVRTEYAPGHARHGQIWSWDDSGIPHKRTADGRDGPLQPGHTSATGQTP
jgi:hypothetical protein